MIDDGDDLNACHSATYVCGARIGIGCGIYVYYLPKLDI